MNIQIKNIKHVDSYISLQLLNTFYNEIIKTYHFYNVKSHCYDSLRFTFYYVTFDNQHVNRMVINESNFSVSKHYPIYEESVIGISLDIKTNRLYLLKLPLLLLLRIMYMDLDRQDRPILQNYNVQDSTPYVIPSPNRLFANRNLPIMNMHSNENIDASYLQPQFQSIEDFVYSESNDKTQILFLTQRIGLTFEKNNLNELSLTAYDNMTNAQLRSQINARGLQLYMDPHSHEDNIDLVQFEYVPYLDSLVYLLYDGTLNKHRLMIVNVLQKSLQELELSIVDDHIHSFMTRSSDYTFRPVSNERNLSRHRLYYIKFHVMIPQQNICFIVRYKQKTCLVTCDLKLISLRSFRIPSTLRLQNIMTKSSNQNDFYLYTLDFCECRQIDERTCDENDKENQVQNASRSSRYLVSPFSNVTNTRWIMDNQQDDASPLRNLHDPYDATEHVDFFVDYEQQIILLRLDDCIHAQSIQSNLLVVDDLLNSSPKSYKHRFEKNQNYHYHVFCIQWPIIHFISFDKTFRRDGIHPQQDFDKLITTFVYSNDNLYNYDQLAKIAYEITPDEDSNMFFDTTTSPTNDERAHPMFKIFDEIIKIKDVSLIFPSELLNLRAPGLRELPESLEQHLQLDSIRCLFDYIYSNRISSEVIKFTWNDVYQSHWIPLHDHTMIFLLDMHVIFNTLMMYAPQTMVELIIDRQILHWIRSDKTLVITRWLMHYNQSNHHLNTIKMMINMLSMYFRPDQNILFLLREYYTNTLHISVDRVINRRYKSYQHINLSVLSPCRYGHIKLLDPVMLPYIIKYMKDNKQTFTYKIRSYLVDNPYELGLDRFLDVDVYPSDVQILTLNRSLKCHWWVLINHSAFFRNMIMSNSKEVFENKIDLTFFPLEYVLQLIFYVYTGMQIMYSKDQYNEKYKNFQDYLDLFDESETTYDLSMTLNQ